jgi:peptidoglycan/LPS O-acetylase OafA/YrhL
VLSEPSIAAMPLRSPTSRSHRWRPEIQGLQAVAVLLVVLFHAGVVDGGFVGVDVFFVISGFLISRQLMDSASAGFGATLLDFYERRVRRIIPAASLVIVVTVVAGRWILTPLDWRELSGDGAASATFSMNLRLQEQGIDYLRADMAPSALQHYWSLAIEEQFYLLWPVAVLIARSIHRRAVPVLVAVGFVASLAWMLVSDVDSSSAFFGLPTRAWQLLAGTAGYLVTSRWPRLTAGSRFTDLLAAGALVMVVAVVGPSTIWPGPWTVLLTAAVVGLVVSPGVLARVLLSPRPMQWIGDRSFSWYLLHFPPLIFAEVLIGESVNVWLGLSISAATLAGADLMYRRFEQPMRKVPLARRTVLFAGVLAIVIVGGSAAVAQRLAVDGGAASTEPAVRIDHTLERSALLDREAQRSLVPNDIRPAIVDARDDRHEAYENGCHAAFDERVATPCVLTAGADLSVLILGDSQAANWLPALEGIARTEGWMLSSMTKSGCTPAAAETYVRQLNRWYTECPVWRESALAQVRDQSYDVVLVAGSSSYLDVSRTAERYPEAAWSEALATSLQQLRALSDVYYLHDTATFLDDLPACLSANLRSADTCAGSVDVVVDTAYGDLERRVTDEAGVKSVSTLGIVCGTERCPTFVGNTLWYRDSNHFTTLASSSFAPELHEALIAAGLPR